LCAECRGRLAIPFPSPEQPPADAAAAPSPDPEPHQQAEVNPGPPAPPAVDVWSDLGDSRDDRTPPARRRPARRSGWPFRLSTPREIALTLLAIGGVVLVLIVANALLSHGNRLEFNGGELYYTSAVTRDQATRLGHYLVREGVFDGERKTVQLDRSGRTYQVRMVVKKGIDTDPAFIGLARQLAADLSRKVFDSDPVEIHFCDEGLNTLRVVIPLTQ
jgi:hypothetical protein